MANRHDALDDIIRLMKSHGITIDEIATALLGNSEAKAKQNSSILARLFGYIGGLFIISGMTYFIGMQWDEMSTLPRILTTLGSGFCLFIMAITCTMRDSLEKAATPLFLLAALLEPTGILVTLSEFSRGGNPAHGMLFMCCVMAIQQGFTFWAKDRTVLALTTLFFGSFFFAIAFDLMHIDANLIGIVMGLSLTCIGWSLGRSKHQSIAPICYLLGPIIFLCAMGDWLYKTPFEILFLGLACGTIFLSTVVRSGTLLAVGTLATLGYVGYFMDKHFSDSLAGPIGLMLLGVMLIGAGVLAVRINNKYIKQKM
ncbi:DUF2157 domain-containing protein [Chitinibacter sp. FCG-7]|uniref:DUF2157 domain-containing protein n=1 Tax=Chitinibacter mangrovi TaxID=3153927 RepID=A0AAU7F7N2_9NEIS